MSEGNLPEIPRFASEAGRGAVVVRPPDELSEDILAAARNGTLGEGSLGRAARKRAEAEKRAAAAEALESA